MKTWCVLLWLCLPLCGQATAPVVMPEPAELEPDIRFWMQVYSRISTNEGYIHDQHNLAVIYQTLHFDADLPPRQREPIVTAARERYQAILRRLGSGATPQDADERRVRDLWAGADLTRLTLAADDIRFQLGQSDRFRAGLQRAGAWEGHIADTLAALGLPPEISVLPHVESSFQPAAMSKAGAAGLWQFIRSTGRRYLRIDKAVDERLDPYRSTAAAAQLLAYNYRVLGTWPLAITAYNHGAEGMRRARDQVGSNDIVQIVRHFHSPSFGFASRNYYCSFLAALRIDRNPEKFFGALKRDPPAVSQELALTLPTRVDALEQALKVDSETLRLLNPALRSAVWDRKQPVPGGYRLRVPASLKSWNTALLAARLSGQAAAPDAAPARVARSVPSAASHLVATSFRARAARVLAAVRPRHSAIEPIGSPSSPQRRGGRSATEIATAAAAYDAAYVVRGGDTLATIAVQTGIDAEALVHINGLRDGDHIYEGQRLSLAGGAPHAAATALLAAQAVAEDAQDEAQAHLASSRVTPVLSAAQAQAQGPNLVADAAAPPSADPIDYSVDNRDRVRVVAAETVGHYADWLGVSAISLRQLNSLRGRRAMLVGMPFRLNFSRVTRVQFEQRRRDYHKRLQTEYFAAHRIVGTEAYVARRGDSLWSVTQRGALPVWLLQQYNPDINFAALRPGTQILVPRVEDAS